ncbi:MAG: EAL domain-containing protein [Geminicoccaceae bacterium]|nr:MAG: EAL domain-containing protein [Geminicoccaceae bacterium]
MPARRQHNHRHDPRIVAIDVIQAMVDGGHNDARGQNSARSTVLQIEFDHVELLTTTYGRHVLAAWTRAAAGRVALRLRAGDRVAIAAPGHLLVLLVDASERAAVLAVIRRLQAALGAKFEVQGRSLRVACTFAAAGLADEAARRQGLWLALESAADAAKNQPSGGVGWPSVAASADLDGCRQRRRELLEAADAARFFPVFQPQLDLETGRFDRVEVLMRWQRRDGSIAAPGLFLDDLRHLGRLAEVSHHVYTQALASVQAWSAQGHGLARVALNLDLCQVQQPQWAEPLLGMIEASGLPAGRVELEISEHILEAADIDRLIEGLVRLQAAGVEISLDDFGAGYGSLTQLARLPVDLVKLDARLLWGADTTPRTRTLVQSVVAMTGALDLPCVFEGIETAGQLDLARASGARYGQGFFLARPLHADQVPAVLDDCQYVTPPPSAGRMPMTAAPC